jgi:hypothetical protein
MTAKLNEVDPLAWLTDVLVASRAFRKASFTSCCLGNGSARRPLPLRRPVQINMTPGKKDYG